MTLWRVHLKSWRASSTVRFILFAVRKQWEKPSGIRCLGQVDFPGLLHCGGSNHLCPPFFPQSKAVSHVVPQVLNQKPSRKPLLEAAEDHKRCENKMCGRAKACREHAESISSDIVPLCGPEVGVMPHQPCFRRARCLPSRLMA